MIIYDYPPRISSSLFGESNNPKHCRTFPLMIFHEFPDLVWLKSQIAQWFNNRLGWGNLPLETEGFPSVIIHTKVRECFRPDIKGPFSFFLNIKGNSSCSVDRQTTRIDENSYFVSNRSQLYTLQVEENSGG